LLASVATVTSCDSITAIQRHSGIGVMWCSQSHFLFVIEGANYLQLFLSIFVDRLPLATCDDCVVSIVQHRHI